MPSAVKIRRLIADTVQSPQYGRMKPSNLVKPFMNPRLSLVPYFLRHVAYCTARENKNNLFCRREAFQKDFGIILTSSVQGVAEKWTPKYFYVLFFWGAVCAFNQAVTAPMKMRRSAQTMTKSHCCSFACLNDSCLSFPMIRSPFLSLGTAHKHNRSRWHCKFRGAIFSRKKTILPRQKSRSA